MSHRFPAFVCGVIAAGMLACASGSGESYAWKRPCATDAQREADRQACMGESAGLADPSGYTGVEYARDLFEQCMESKGWRRLPADEELVCR
jgi:hypothetical protein